MPFSFSKRSLERMEGVHPDLVAVMELAIQRTPIDFTVLEGLRSVERQRELVAQGASKTMNSRHLTGHAIDVAPLSGGQVSWDWPLYHKLAPVIKGAAADLGVDLEWGGDWRSFKDGPHWQLSWNTYGKTDMQPRASLDQEMTQEVAALQHRRVVPETVQQVVQDAAKPVTKSSTIWALLTAGGGTVAAVWKNIQEADPQTLLAVAVVLAALIYVFRERLRKIKLGRAAKEALGL